MIVAANWKMNLSLEAAGALAHGLAMRRLGSVCRLLFVPHPYVLPMSIRLQASDVRLGGQDCHQAESGAHTGDVSAMMLRDCGAVTVLLGHSERRSDHNESSALVAAKAAQALAYGLDIVVCIGETLAERQAGVAEDVVIQQLRDSLPTEMPAGKITIAYEPVWAIGTGMVASLDDIAAMHQAIAKALPNSQNGSGEGAIPVLYGGSVKADNAADIFALPHVSGGLVGGASLELRAFDAICDAAADITTVAGT